jgi:hypothetical protein
MNGNRFRGVNFFRKKGASQFGVCNTIASHRTVMTSMAKHERDTEAHRKAAEKITFERELCLDLINKHLIKVPEDKRPYVRLTLNDAIIQLRKLWRPSENDNDENQGFSGEWKRDRRALLRLIKAVFDRWEKACFERPLMTHQLATNPENAPEDITSYLDKKGIGASEAAKTKTLRLIEAKRAADRQELSRGSRPFRVPEEKRIPKEKGDLIYMSLKLGESSSRL